MSFHVIFCFAVSTILLTHSKIASVNGQCTTEGCGHDDISMNIITEIQQQIVQALGPLNTQTQNMHNVLIASFQQLTSQLNAVMRSLHAVDRRLEEHDIYIKQGQHFHELLLNASFQEMKSQHETVNKSFQAVDRRLLEQSQSIQVFLNESFQEIKSEQGNVMRNLQAAGQSSQEHNICTKHISGIHELLNESSKEMKIRHDTVMTKLQAVERRSQEHDIYNFYIRQSQGIQELLNESFQQAKGQHETVMVSLQEMKRQHAAIMISVQAVDRRSQEHNICIRQSQDIREFLNESDQQTKSQYDSVNLSLQALDRRLQSYQIDIKNQTQQSWKLVNGICDSVYPVRDCSDIKSRGHTENGVYEVCVGHPPNRVCTNAFCDMKSSNTSSLVFQRRKDGSVNFNRTWVEYRDGFGNPDGEFWLGNEVLYLLTSKRNYKLRVDLEDFNGTKRYAEYTKFSINSSTNNYRLTIGGYSGNAGDSLNYHNGRQFTINDAENDEDGGNCARTYGGGWWYGSCFDANLNSKYRQRYETFSNSMGIHWLKWHSTGSVSLKSTEMKLIPVD